jgi:hypothetical protein
MYGLLGVSSIVTGVTYLIIQHSQSKNEHEPPANNIPVLVVVFLVTLIGTFWMNGIFGGDGTSRAPFNVSMYEDSLVARIPDNCLTGVPPF